MLERIPTELRHYRQWICWRLEDMANGKSTKLPFDPRNGRLASVDDPTTWTDYDTALQYVGYYSGLGFVLTANDPFAFIDLDATSDKSIIDKQYEIFQGIETYAERSPSGSGLHLICKASVPNGRKRSCIEVYSSLRYMTMTGDVFRDCPITEQHFAVRELWAKMATNGGAAFYDPNVQQTMSDEEIINRALAAGNGDKFRALQCGQYQQLGYPSQSEADLAFIDIVAFYTQSREQITRIFRSSALGQRPKALRTDYLATMINKSFDRLLPPIDFSGIQYRVARVVNEETPSTSGNVNGVPGPATASGGNGLGGPTEAADDDHIDEFATPVNAYTVPPGLMGEIAQFIFQVVPRPVPEIALAAAIGLMAGLCGRAYNTFSGAGLNLYILALAETGSGKEGAKSGIDALLNEIRPTFPAIMQIKGPGDIASGQGLIRFLSKGDRYPSCVAILGEMGLKIEQWTSKYANSAQGKIMNVVLDLFHKSGHGQSFDPVVYSESEKNIEAVLAPSFSILGESTPQTFYETLDDRMITTGFLPRFMIIEYLGSRPDANPVAGQIRPSDTLKSKFSDLAAMCFNLNKDNRVLIVRFEETAHNLLARFDKYCDLKIRGDKRDVIKNLWSRSHLQAMKLASLVAIGCNYIEPVVTFDQCMWAIGIVVKTARLLVQKFDAGEIGIISSDQRQANAMKDKILDWARYDRKRLSWLKLPEELKCDKTIVPWTFLQQQLVSTANFKTSKEGATRALTKTMQTLIDTGILREISNNPHDFYFGKRCGYSGKLYAILNPEALNTKPRR